MSPAWTDGYERLVSSDQYVEERRCCFVQRARRQQRRNGRLHPDDDSGDYSGFLMAAFV